MDSSPVSPCLALIQLHPIKALDSVPVKEARIGPGGGLELDRVWALYSADGQWVNGKRTPAVHLIRAAYAPDLTAVTLSVPGDRERHGSEIRSVRGANQVDGGSAFAVHPLPVRGVERPDAVELEAAARTDAGFFHRN